MLNIGQMSKLAGENEHVLQKIGWQMVNLPLETANAFANWYTAYASEKPESIEGMKELLDLSPGRIQCISKMKKGSGPILCLGSGSSLDAIMPTIKNFKGAVMCSTTQCGTLVKYGRIPDYILCLDPRDPPADELAAPDWGDAVMIGHVSIPHTYVARWLKRARGPLYMGRIMEPNYDWYSHHLGRGYPWIRHVFMPMIDSAAGEIAFATWLGYSPIYLAGIDYCGPRFDRWDWNYKTSEWVFDGDTSKVDTKDMDLAFQRLTPTRALAYSSRGTLISAFYQMTNEKYKQTIYQLSKTTVLNQFPLAEWNGGSIINPESYDRQAVIDSMEMAMAIWDTFMVPLYNGWGLDHHTYIADKEENLFGALIKYNGEIADNMEEFKRIEEAHKHPLKEMMANGYITVEAGDLLLHGAEEFKNWDWHEVKPIDIMAMLNRRRWLLDEAKKRGLERGFIPQFREMAPGDYLKPEVQKLVDQNKCNIPQETTGIPVSAVEESIRKTQEAAVRGENLEPGVDPKSWTG
jgi:hypothetical protein